MSEEMNRENIENVAKVDEAAKKGKGKKNKFTMFFKSHLKSIIACLVAVLLFIGAGIYFIFFYNNITGIWTTKENNADKSLNFRNDGTVSMIISSVEILGKYELKPNNVINIDIKLESNKILVGDFNYKIENGLMSKNLILTDSAGKAENYSQVKDIDMKISSDFKVKNEIVGTWISDEYKLECTFTNDGRFIRKSSNVIVTLTYTIDDSYINFVQRLGNQAQEGSLQYSLEGNKLFLQGVEFNKK